MPPLAKVLISACTGGNTGPDAPDPLSGDVRPVITPAPPLVDPARAAARLSTPHGGQRKLTGISPGRCSAPMYPNRPVWPGLRERPGYPASETDRIASTTRSKARSRAGSSCSKRASTPTPARSAPARRADPRPDRPHRRPAQGRHHRRAAQDPLRQDPPQDHARHRRRQRRARTPTIEDASTLEALRPLLQTAAEQGHHPGISARTPASPAVST